MSQANPTDAETDTYAREFIEHGDRSKAWRATFPNSKAKQEIVHSRASHFHKISKVQARIEELNDLTKEIAKEKFGIDAEFILNAAKDLYDKSMGNTPIKKIIMSDGIPDTVEVKEFNHQGAGKAIELMGKHVDVKAWDKEQSTTINLNISELDEARRVLEKFGIDPDSI